MNDITVGTAFIIGIILLIAVFFADRAVVVELAGNLNFVVWAILQGLRFAAGITILLYGVRLFLGEIVPAFRGILKNHTRCKTCFGCSCSLPYAPTAVLVGFISSTIVFLILMVIFGVTGYATIVPSMIMLFFQVQVLPYLATLLVAGKELYLVVLLTVVLGFRASYHLAHA